ncbi:MAG: hypothetical protein ACK5YI_06445 [Rhodospirillales bacterium]|jgi:hypothetical protein
MTREPTMTIRPAPLARLAEVLSRALTVFIGRRPYRPEKRYMRGGGPRSAERRGEAGGARPAPRRKPDPS